MITTYQIRNVLRIYGNQLKKSTLPITETAGLYKYSPEIIDISMEARSKQLADKVSNDIISKIDQREYRHDQSGEEDS